MNSRPKWKPILTSKGQENRATIITPEMIDKSIEIHNGNSYKTIKISIDHVGHRLGEFYSTRHVPTFKVKKKKLK